MNEKEIQEDRNGTEIKKSTKQINRDKKECVVEYRVVVGEWRWFGTQFGTQFGDKKVTDHLLDV